MTDSPFQLRIYDFILNDSRSLIVNGVAGCGKTTTLVGIVQRIPTSCSAIFLAFNKAIATELETRLPKTCQSSTFHSLCFRALQRANGRQRLKVESQKCFFLFKDLWPSHVKQYGNFVCRLVGYAKNTGFGVLTPGTDSEWHDLIEHYGLIGESKTHDDNYAVTLAQQLLAASNEDTQRVDFDDMLYFCLLQKVVFDKFQYVLVDETQDTNSVQRYILKQLGGRTTRYILVGDPKQAIYGFRGASNDAMDLLKAEFHCEELPLSVTYRCARSIVARAATLVPQILCREDAPDGEVCDRSTYVEDEFRNPKAAILCRNTFPVVSFAYALIKRKVPCKVLGREIGKALESVIERCTDQEAPESVDRMLTALEQYESREVEKFLSKNQEMLAEQVTDRCQCIRILADGINENRRTVSALRFVLSEMFADSNSSSLTLCTIHKSKGLEWDTVYILDAKKYQPSKYAKRPWEREQEKHLEYVAWTRARHNLYFIESGYWKDSKAGTVQTKLSKLLEQD